MATLQKIRNHGVLLLVIVGVAMLAFILGDFLNSGSSFFNRFKAAVINGEEITPQEYSNAVDQAKNALEMDFQYYQGPQFQFSEDTISMIRQQTWQSLLLQTILEKEASAAGMAVTDEEFEQMCFGENPSPVLTSRPFFMGENGQYSPLRLRQFTQYINQDIDEVSPEMAQQANQVNQLRSYWQYWSNLARLTRLQEKYTLLMQQLMVPNKLEAKYAFNSRKDNVDLEYVVFAYDSLKDEVEVSDSEIKKLYKSRKQYYKCTPFRNIEYVAFEKIASEQDYADVEKTLSDKAEEFKTTDNVALLINPISDIRYTGEDYSEETVPSIYKEFAFGDSVAEGKVSAIMLDGASYTMARIMKCGYQTPDSVKFSVVARDTTEQSQPSTWYPSLMLESNLRDSLFAMSVGDTIDYKIEGEEKSILISLDSICSITPKVQMAILQKKVTPSQATRDQIRNRANQFIINNATPDAMRAAAAKEGLSAMQARLIEADDMVNMTKSTRPIVKWAFEAEEVDAASDVFDCGNQYIVAILTEVNDDNYITMDNLRKELEAEIINQKKAAIIKEKFNGVKDMQAAAKIAGTAIQNAQGINLNSYGFAGQQESAVVGTAYKLAANTMSAPIEGENGVYVIRVNQKTTNEEIYDAQQEKQSLKWRYYSASQGCINYLVQNADIEDLRGKYMNE